VTDYKNLVAEARDEAIKDGDPETCLVWEMANAIEALQAEVTRDAAALDRLAWLLSAPEWPGASGMEDVAEIVAATGRDLDQEGASWSRH
jgi:hypothetical protein